VFTQENESTFLVEKNWEHLAGTDPLYGFEVTIETQRFGSFQGVIVPLVSGWVLIPGDSVRIAKKAIHPIAAFPFDMD